MSVDDDRPDRPPDDEPSGARPIPVRPKSAASPPPPTPVRAAMDPRESASAELVVEERRVEVDGRSWTVRVLGRSCVGRDSGVASLLLLGFQPEGVERVDREAMVVGRSLEDLTDGEVATAWSVAHPPRPDAERAAPLFPMASGQRRRDR